MVKDRALTARAPWLGQGILSMFLCMETEFVSRLYKTLFQPKFSRRKISSSLRQKCASVQSGQTYRTTKPRNESASRIPTTANLSICVNCKDSHSSGPDPPTVADRPHRLNSPEFRGLCALRDNGRIPHKSPRSLSLFAHHDPPETDKLLSRKPFTAPDAPVHFEDDTHLLFHLFSLIERGVDPALLPAVTGPVDLTYYPTLL